MTNPNAPAFSEIHISHWQNKDADGNHDNVLPRWHGGLTKREWFVGQAITAAFNCYDSEEVDWTVIGDNAIILADYIIEKLNKSEKESAPTE